MVHQALGGRTEVKHRANARAYAASKSFFAPAESLRSCGADGGAAGLLATIPMTLAMEKLQQMLPREERLPSAQEPLLIVRELLRRIDFDGSLTETQKRRLTWCAHLGYGAACGVGYASLGRRLPVPAPARGALYGVLVWALSYGAWLPALRILPAPLRRPLGRNALLIAAHLIWGVSASLIYERVTASGRAGR